MPKRRKKTAQPTTAAPVKSYKHNAKRAHIPTQEESAKLSPREKQANTLGRKKQKLRKELGLSQDEFVRKAGIPYTTLTKIETGVIKKPSVYGERSRTMFVVAKVAKALNVSVDDLLSH